MTISYGNKIFETVCTLAARHKIVPFLGAGCSKGILSCDWDSIIQEIAKEIGCDPGIGHLNVAQKFVHERSKSALSDFLKKYFIIDTFDDEKGAMPLAIISTGLGTIYTTNQDNVIETCSLKYGRSFKKIVSLNDFSETAPGDRLLIKYHGDLDQPDSIIFSQEDYDSRMADSEHFLNIRLKSDALAKSFLFLGYSFRDSNIQLIFSSLNKLFKGKLPPSYLVCWSYSPELEELTKLYGVQIIDPADIFPDVSSPLERFEQTIDLFSKRVHQLKTDNEIQSMFAPTIPSAIRVLTKYELEALKTSAQDEEFPLALKKFRALVDQTVIPESFQKQVVDTFEQIVKKAYSPEHPHDVNAASHNICLSDPGQMLRVLSLTMASANLLSKGGIMDLFLPRVRGFPSDQLLLAVAPAIEILHTWDRDITDIFKSRISSWFDHGVAFDSLSPAVKDYIEHWINWLWTQKHTTFDNPIARQQQLIATGHHRPNSHTYEKIYDKIMSSLPKKFKKPHED